MKKLFEIQDECGDCIARYRTFHQAMGGLDVWLKQRKVDREMLENKIERAQDELDNLKKELLEIVEVEATEQRLTYMKNWEKTGLSLFEDKEIPHPDFLVYPVLIPSTPSTVSISLFRFGCLILL